MFYRIKYRPNEKTPFSSTQIDRMVNHGFVVHGILYPSGSPDKPGDIMINIEEQKELLDRLVKLNPLEIRLLIINLFQEGKIDFVELSKMYVHILEENNKKKSERISSLGLMLGMYCMTDASGGGKAARKHLYESGMYGHNDGSGFGKMLDDEFGGKLPDQEIKFLETN